MKHFDHAARRALAVSLVVVVLLFVAIACLARWDALSGPDQGAAHLLRGDGPSPLKRPMRLVSDLAHGKVLLPLTLACSIYLWRRGRTRLALALPLIGVAAVVTLPLLKSIVNKPRPSLRDYGFPSGHTFAATVFVMTAVYLLWHLDAPRRWQGLARAAGVIFVVAVGASRLFVNAHWLSDVVGGLLAGLAFALVTMLIVDARLR
jgi:undecaprenyl-diphosphatase